MKGSPFGTHRVIGPAGTLPQATWKLDNRMDIYDNEILIDVSMLNIDSASFTQIRESVGNDVAKIKEMILKIVGDRGKLHNPVTGSGGMLVGTVSTIGPALRQVSNLQAGERVATLVSLTLTPLCIEEIKQIHLDRDQVEVAGKAVLFETGVYAKLPRDIPESIALAVLDVAGAPAQTARLVQPGNTVLIVGGGGKSGVLCSCVASKLAGKTGTIIGIGSGARSCGRMAHLGWVDHIIRADATDGIAVMQAVAAATGGRMADITINCVNIPGTEMASVLSTRDQGVVYFFSMATSFTAAALGAEGIGKDVTMLIGNGYAAGHSEMALQLLRENPALNKLFHEQYL